MFTYKLYKTVMSDKVNAAMYQENGSTTSFFFIPDTAEYDSFKENILTDKAMLQDSEGTLMTAEQAKEFVLTLL